MGITVFISNIVCEAVSIKPINPPRWRTLTQRVDLQVGEEEVFIEVEEAHNEAG